MFFLNTLISLSIFINDILCIKFSFKEYSHPLNHSPLKLEKMETKVFFVLNKDSKL